MHHKFKQKEIKEISSLIHDIEENSEVKNKLLDIISRAFSQRSLELIQPEQFLEALLDIDVITHQNPTLEELRKKFLLSVFKDTYSGVIQFQTFEEITNKIEGIRDKACIKAWRVTLENFNMLEKSTLRMHNIAVNIIDPQKKISNLSDALQKCNIGGQSSLIILRDLAKLLLGHSVGKTERDVERDGRNKIKQKQKVFA